MKRQRDAILEAVLLFTQVNRNATLRELVAFLYICENEGLNVQELADLTMLSQTTASRAARALGPPGSEWAGRRAMGLVEAYRNSSDGRSHILRLTPKGRALRDALDEVIRRAAPIAM